MGERAAQALVFFTSAAILVIEILAGRLMAPYVGVSIETFTGIIGVILAGIALGNAAGGMLADRHAPHRLLGPALSIGGLLAWASLPIVSFVGPNTSPGSAGIIVLAGLAFFAPAAVLSTVSPMVAKLAVSDLERTGTVVGGLSAAGTVGALVGTFVTGFVLVVTFATRPVIIALGLVLVVSGAVLSVRFGGGRRPSASLVLLAVLLLGAGIAADDRCGFESAYTCGRVRVDAQDPSIRILELDGVSHSSIDLDDPTNLGFRYIRLFAAVMSEMPAGPLDVLHVGGGGFSMPQYVAAVRPGSSSLVLEIDPELVEVAERELGLVTSDSLRIQTGDARIALDDLDAGSRDLVIGDAFSGASVPWHLTTSEVVAEIDRILRRDGVYVMNVIDAAPNRFARAMAATLSLHFDHVGVLLPADGIEGYKRNQVLVASDAPLPPATPDADDGVWAPDIAAFIDGQRHLTDDFAPADQLATR